MTRFVGTAAVSVCAALLGALTPGNGWGQQEQTPPDVLVHEEEESARVFRELLDDEARALSLQDTEEYGIIQLVDMMMVMRITKLLELDDDESIRLFQCMHTTLDKIHKLKWERGALHYYLREDIANDAPEAVIQAKLDRAIEIEEQLAALIRKWVTLSKAELTTKQRAQLFLFGFDFEKEIVRLIERAEAIAVERHGPVSDEFKQRTHNGASSPRPETAPQGDRDR
jgi:hypothetical protein